MAIHPSALRAALALATTAALSTQQVACDRDFNQAELTAMTLTPAQLPASPTNAVADDPLAVQLGRSLFFERRLSSDGTIACASCHDAAQGFSDPKAFSLGVRGQQGGRHAMPITAAAMHPYLLWDGRADSVWSQPLKALENPKEMDFTRAEVAHFVAGNYATEYEAVFGPLPDLTGAPARGGPSIEGWEAVPARQRDDIQRVFSNVGKAIEAYERKILCTDTRLDRWARGEVQFTDAEASGAAVFQRSGCDNCHSGPTFSDGQFHNIGIPSADRGRALGAPALFDDIFSGAGDYSDDRTAGQARLDPVRLETGIEGSFRTASLRGVGQRRFFGHAGHQETLRGFLLDVYRRGRGGRGRGATVGSLDPKLDRVNLDGDDVDDLIAFLHTLDCPPLPADLAAPAAPATTP